jgi:elongation factor P
MRAGDFRRNSIFKMDGHFYRVVETTKVQQPRMVAFVRASIKNLETGAVQEKRFNTDDMFPDVDMTRKEMQFGYEDGGLYYFIDLETGDLVPVNGDMCEDALQYNTEANEIMFTFEYADDKLLNITPPTFVVLTVVETEPAVPGDTARSALKGARLESGLEIQVPMFVKSGDRVKVDTRDATYSERA